MAHLTDAGLEVLRATAPGHVANARRLVFDRLTRDETAQLGALSAMLLAPLDDRSAQEGPAPGASRG